MDSNSMTKAKVMMYTIRKQYFGITEEDFRNTSENVKVEGKLAMIAFSHVLYSDDFTEEDMAEILEYCGLDDLADELKKPDDLTIHKVKKVREMTERMVANEGWIVF
jgi:hypothetical protein